MGHNGNRGAARALLAAAALAAAGLLSLSCSKPGPEAGQKGEEPLRIAIAFDVGGRGDGAFNDSAYAGLVQVAKAYGGRIVGDPDRVDHGGKVELRYLESKLGGQDREQLLRVLSEEGNRLVFGVGFMFAESIARVAKDFPNVHYALIDGVVPDLTEGSNVTCLGFAEEEGSFLVGALSGLAVADKPGAKVGFIGGMDTPLIHRFQAGFAAGAAYANPRLRKPGMVLGQYIGRDGSAFNDPKTAAAIASTMYKGGAEIVYHAAGGSGAGLFEAAAAAGKLAVGVDSDQGYSLMTDAKNPAARELGGRVLTSMLKRVDQAVFLTAKELVESGKVRGGYRTFSLADDGVGVATNEFNSGKLAPYAAELDALKARIVAGGIKVPADAEAAAAFVKGLK